MARLSPNSYCEGEENFSITLTKKSFNCSCRHLSSFNKVDFASGYSRSSCVHAPYSPPRLDSPCPWVLLSPDRQWWKPSPLCFSRGVAFFSRFSRSDNVGDGTQRCAECLPHVHSVDSWKSILSVTVNHSPFVLLLHIFLFRVGSYLVPLIWFTHMAPAATDFYFFHNFSWKV